MTTLATSSTSNDQVFGSYIEGTAAGDELLMEAYPEHIYDPTRRHIAAQLLSKEIAKITKAGDTQLAAIYSAIEGLFDEQSVEHPVVREFWSVFELVTKAKTKRCGKFLTASNVCWTNELIRLDSLPLLWMPFLSEREPLFGKAPWDIKRVREVFAANPKLFAEAKRSNQQNIAEQKLNRSNQPIIVVRDEHGKLDLLDGSGRLYAALMRGEGQINCWVGTTDGHPLKDYWVSAGNLLHLCDQATGRFGEDPRTADAAVRMLKELLKNRVAYANYCLWVRSNFPELDNELGL